MERRQAAVRDPRDQHLRGGGGPRLPGAACGCLGGRSQKTDGFGRTGLFGLGIELGAAIDLDGLDGEAAPRHDLFEEGGCGSGGLKALPSGAMLTNRAARRQLIGFEIRRQAYGKAALGTAFEPLSSRKCQRTSRVCNRISKGPS